MKALFLLCGTFLLAGCAFTPTGVAPVERFELERYLGTWYEIARLDHAGRVAARRMLDEACVLCPPPAKPSVRGWSPTCDWLSATCRIRISLWRSIAFSQSPLFEFELFVALEEHGC